MKRRLKGLLIVIFYLFLAWILLEKDIRQIFEPGLAAVLLCGGIILSLPYLQKGAGWRQLKEIFGQNALMAGYLEGGMLIFLRLHQYDQAQADGLLNDLMLDLRPVIYGFICYLACRNGKIPQQEESARKAENSMAESEASEKSREEYAETAKKKEYDMSVLTKREKQIAELIKRGLSNREIGEELYISEATVKKHVSHIFEKLQIESRRDLR